MSTPIHSDMLIKDEFLASAARTFFLMAFADYVENEDREDDGHEYPVASCGADYDDLAPERVPPAAYAMAGELWGALAALNKATAPCGVISLVSQAAAADGVEESEIDVARFADCMAKQAMGSGVSWFDDHEEFPLETPDFEVHGYTFDPAAYREE